MSQIEHPLRQVAPISIAGLTPAMPATGIPICEMVDPRTLWVDPAYQRLVGEKGLKQVRRIIENWDWAKFKPPVCAFSEDGNGESILKVLDGQHTAIAAASNPNVPQIPVMIVEAASTERQADAFLGQNRDRLGITALQLHYAAVTAGDPEAVTVAQVCERAGVSILRYTAKEYKPRETVAVKAIEGLIARRGAMRARQMIEVLAKADLAPITSAQIKAVEHLSTEDEFKDAIETDDLVEAIAALGWTIDDEAKVFAATHRVPTWKALASIWFRKCKKKRKAA